MLLGVGGVMLSVIYYRAYGAIEMDNKSLQVFLKDQES